MTTLYLFRHGQTEWALSGKHTGRSDIPLTEAGRLEAIRLGEAIRGLQFDAVFVSPLLRARETARLAGLGEAARICDDLAEIDYGQYEGLTTAQIRQTSPNWTVFTHPCPSGESLERAAERCARVIATAGGIDGQVALFAHGHILRILATVWLKLPPTEGRRLMLDTGTMSILSHEHDTPAIKQWNCPAGLHSH